MSHNDYQMALLLQQQYEHESNIDSPRENLVYEKKKYRNDTKSLTDPSWELIDPTPDIHMLFMAFNEKYFWNKLLAVCVSWSKRMTTCAGICSYQGRGGLCHVTLSEPLLKLRPRKDLVETLLHEMIHAYLFVTHNNRDRDGHGPEFHKHMYRINAEAGTNITVYHNFHDEVRLYKQHWWRCDGPCQKRKPYFGMVRRAMNRSPGPNDFWWKQHQETCGGKFIKVKEPDKPLGKENKPTSPNNDIRKFIPVLKGKISSIFANTPSSSNPTIMGFKDLNMAKPKNALSNSSSTIVINKKPSTSTKQPDLPNKCHLVQTKLTSSDTFCGKGLVLGSSQCKDNSDYATVRNHWLNKFPLLQKVATTTNKRSSDSDSSISEILPKRIRANLGYSNDIQKSSESINLVDNSDRVECPVCQKLFSEAGLNSHLDQCLQNQAITSSTNDLTSRCPICDIEIETAKLEEHVQVCVNEVFNSSDEFTSDEFKPTEEELIPCLVCNKNIIKSELNVHLDDCMGNNIFNNSGNVTEEEENVKNESEDKKFNCPVCFEKFTVTEMSSHLDQCLLNDSATSEGDSVISSFWEESF